MNQPRVDLYTGTHKALRRTMYETGIVLAHTNFADSSEKGAALAALFSTLGFLDEHLVHEDRHVCPLTAEAAPTLGATLSAEHEEHEATSKALRALASGLEGAEGAAAVGLGARLCQSYNEMLGNQTVHMNREETAGNEVLWAAHSDDFLASVRARIQGEIPPPRFAEWLQLMIPSMNHQELVGALSGMKLGAPPEVFARVSGMAKTLLGARWAAVETALLQ